MAKLNTTWVKRKIGDVLTKTFAIAHVKSTYYNFEEGTTLDDVLIETEDFDQTAVSESEISPVILSKINSVATQQSANFTLLNTNKAEAADVYSKEEIDIEIDTLKKSVSDGKSSVANAITDKGVPTATDATFETMSNNIESITTISEGTADATAEEEEILSGKTAYVKSVKVTGTMPNNGTKNASLNCGDSYNIPAGYHNGSGKVTANSLASQTDSTATASQILAGQTAYVKGVKITGTMTNQGAKTASLNCGGSYTIPAGYHNGSGKVTANSLASQTDSTATASQILTGKTAYVKGKKVTGTMANQGAKTATLNAGGSYTIPAGYHNGNGKVTASSLSDQTSGTATSDKIVIGETAYVNGEKVIGTLGKRTSVNDNKCTPLSDGLSVGRQLLSGATVGNYALFAGGTNGNVLSTVDVYDMSFTRRTISLYLARMCMSGASFGEYALFAGGCTTNNDQGDTTNYVDVFDRYLSRTAVSLSYVRSYISSAVIGNYVLFAGGHISDTSMSSVVDAYNKSLTRTTVAPLSQTASSVAGGTIGDYAIFAGGSTGFSSYTNIVTAYNASLVKTNPTSLSKSRFSSAVANVGEYVLIAGGYNNGSGQFSTVDAYNKSLTRSTPTELSVARWNMGGNSIGGYAVFAGGYSISSKWLSTVDTYDSSLTRGTSLQSLSVPRSALSSTKLGHHAFFAGGGNNGALSSVIDIYSSYTGDIITIPETIIYL